MAAMPSPMSKPEMPLAIGAATGRGAATGAWAGLTEEAVATAGAAARAAEEAGGAEGAALVAAGAATATATGAAAAVPLECGGVPGASVGNFIVGAEVGLGGKLMRTVSFLGWTLAASAGLGGMAPPGGVGTLSAIIFVSSCSQPKVAPHRCQTRIYIFPGTICSLFISVHQIHAERIQRLERGLRKRQIGTAYFQCKASVMTATSQAKPRTKVGKLAGNPLKVFRGFPSCYLPSFRILNLIALLINSIAVPAPPVPSTLNFLP